MRQTNADKSVKTFADMQENPGANSVTGSKSYSTTSSLLLTHRAPCWRPSENSQPSSQSNIFNEAQIQPARRLQIARGTQSYRLVSKSDDFIKAWRGRIEHRQDAVVARIAELVYASLLQQL